MALLLLAVGLAATSEEVPNEAWTIAATEEEEEDGEAASETSWARSRTAGGCVAQAQFGAPPRQREASGYVRF